ncbi:MAG: HAD family hydrolase [Acidobacteriota bacterium]
MAPTASPALLIADLDHTLWDWASFIVPSLRAMVASIEGSTCYSCRFILRALRQTYQEHGTVEYAFALQESAIWRRWVRDRRGTLDEFLREVVDPASAAFASERRARLAAYPGVHATLHRLKQQSVRVAGLTDAPAFPAEQRLKYCGLDDCFDALYALKNYHIPRSPSGQWRVKPEILRRMRSGHYRSMVPRVVQIPARHQKPDPRGVLRILRDFDVRPHRAIYLGDSLHKDGGAARAAGVRFVWARYGTHLSDELLEELSLYTPAEVRRRNCSPQAGETHRRSEIECFADILRELDSLR